MTCTDEATAVDQLFTVRRGDAWVFDVAQTSDDDLSDWDAGTLVVQIRDAANEAATLVASSIESDEADDVAFIDTTGTSFGDGDSAIRLVMVDTEKLPAGSYFIEAQLEVDGLVRTIVPGQTQSAQQFVVLAQVAIGGGS